MARGTQASPQNGSYARSSAKEATEIVLAARKTWKLMRSKREKVWPPLIEATLIEALQKYRPQSVTDIQLLQRFPKRNCWISKYIKRRTGHDRSPKQVGSRLQQLRDSCRDERILQLLSRKQYDDNDDNDSVTSCSTSLDSFGSTPPSESTGSPHSSSPVSAPSPSTDPAVYTNDAFAQEAKRRTLVRIELASPLSHSPISFDTISSNREIGPTIVCVDLKLTSLVTTLFSWKNPMVSLHSARVLDGTEHHCLFKVFLDGVMVHLDRTPIGLQSTSTQTRNGTTRQMYLYETKFLPKYWTECFSSVDLACCEVQQCLIKRRLISDNDADFLSLKEHHEDEVVHTVRYTFVDLRSTPPSTPSDEPAELWTPPMEEASHESPLNGSVTHVLDALGLDAPTALPEAESSGDGRAHFPVKEESHTPLSGFSPLSQDSSDGMPEPPVQSTQCLYELADHTQPTTYEFDFSTSSFVNDMPALVYPSAYTATAFTPQCNHPLTFSSTEWLQQGHWTGQAQGYQPQHPETISNPHDKRYAYFWEQPISYAHLSSYLGQTGPLSCPSTACETQGTQEPYAYAQPDYMMTPMGSAHSDYLNDLYQTQDDQKIRGGPCVVYENVSHSPCSDSSSELTYAPETLMANSTYSHTPPPPYVCAPGNENGYQMCSPAQVWS
ncbi:hypothetical protein C8J55DRAFT_76735 [Lentinula edodes]|uniref:TEA domain-containing protein n=1 Tax=Lentinula lateritia TaxID=40482 RepID=A0A9W9ACU3_9AGAR|nr:hypothetical protein C8J55DRAFT_76735 [Lentinula edodes]